MATLRELKTRIGSVSSSEKITGAMKMISSAKVHKFEQALKRLLPYRDQIKSIMGHLLDAEGDYTSPLIEARNEVKRVGVAVFGSDDGLCGAYNINIFKQVIILLNQLRAKYGKDIEIELYPVGKKIVRPCEKIKGNGVTVTVPDYVNSKMGADSVSKFTYSLQDKFINGELDEVM